jgi:excisionase family DNA binding protein
MENINEERWISLKEACKYLGVTRQTVLNWIEKKGLPSAKVGKLWKFKTDEIDE